MTRYASMTDLQRNISPDVTIGEPDYAAPSRTPEHMALLNAGALGDADVLAANAHVAAMLHAAAQTTAAAAWALDGADIPAPTEHEEQCALFAWAAANEAAHPELCCMFAIPNGGHRHPAVAAQLKAEGVRAGVPDICLPIARGRFHSLWIEMKRKPNTTTDAQRQWLDTLHQQGHCAVVCWSAAEAQQTIMAYLGQEG